MSQIADARTPGARRRLLVTAPFPPRLDATVGGSRVVAELVAALAPVTTSSASARTRGLTRA
jgi:hypothetical protein